MNEIWKMILWGSISLLSISIVVLIICYIQCLYRKNKQTQMEFIQDRQIKLNGSNHKKIEYSNMMLEYLRELIAQVAFLKFKEFRDSHDMDKITKATIEKLTTDVADNIKDSINFKNIDQEYLLFNVSFLIQYIIDTTMTILKDLLERHENMEERE